MAVQIPQGKGQFWGLSGRLKSTGVTTPVVEATKK